MPISKWPLLALPSNVGQQQLMQTQLRSLQYQNRKAEYFKAIWEVINWKSVEKRFSA
jgi:hypothetical protein